MCSLMWCVWFCEFCDVYQLEHLRNIRSQWCVSSSDGKVVTFSIESNASVDSTRDHWQYSRQGTTSQFSNGHSNEGLLRRRLVEWSFLHITSCLSLRITHIPTHMRWFTCPRERHRQFTSCIFAEHRVLLIGDTCRSHLRLRLEAKQQQFRIEKF